MSLTKRESPDGCGGEQLGADYEQWCGGLPPLTEDDVEAMAAQDAERRIKDAEAEVGPCGQREGWL